MNSNLNNYFYYYILLLNNNMSASIPSPVLNMTSKKYWCSIDCSDVAVLVGLHKYNTDVYSLVMKYWMRSNYNDYNKTYDKIHVEPVEEIQTPETLIAQICKNVENDTEEDTDEIEDKINEVCDIANQDFKEFPNDKKA